MNIRGVELVERTSSNFRGTSDSGVHSTDIVALPPGMTMANAGEIVNGPICRRPWVGASLATRVNLGVDDRDSEQLTSR